MKRSVLRPLLLTLVAASSSSACFMGYDSRWGQTKAAQRRAASAATPAAIAASPEPSRAAVRPLRVRVHATPSYSAQVIDWPKHVSDAFDAANIVLEPAAGVRLVLDAKSSWADAPADAPLPAMLRALHDADAATDTDLVLGLVGGLPRDGASFHELGYADVLGRHVVLRAAAHTDEAAAIDRSFDELPAEDRARLLRDRRQHRETAVLLHEIGHALGALHERDPHSLMHARYDRSMAGFSAEATDVMRITVDHRSRASSKESGDPALAADLAAYFRQSSSEAWTTGEREAAVARLAGIDARNPSPSPEPAKPDPLAALSDADRAAYERASEAFRASGVARAWEIATPLFAKYPAVYAVQDLRCQLAIVRRLEKAALDEACAVVKSH